MKEHLGDALDVLCVTIAEADATIDVEPLPLARGDARLLGLAIQNLIGNAVKFCGPEPPEVHVSGRTACDRRVIEVADNGIGVAPDQLQRIIQQFVRLHPRAVYVGTGLGRSICQKIIANHGREITAAPRPGGGTTFRLSLPTDASPARAGDA